jgi:hypothetical protein
MVIAAATVVGIAVFAFGMRYQSRTGPGFVDLVERSQPEPEAEQTPEKSLITPPLIVPRVGGASDAPTSVAQNTLYVQVGPYRERAEILTAYLRLRKLGYEATLVPGDDGARLQVFHTTEEREARRMADALFERGFTPALFAADPPAAMARSMKAASTQYGPVGIRVGFEGGKTSGWSTRGTAVGMRNSALYATAGMHSLEVLLQNTSTDSPAQVRDGALKVVLPGDCFTVRVLQPLWSARPVTAYLFITDAAKHVYEDLAVTLEPSRWIELKHVVSQQVTLPLKEIGIQFGGDLPYTGPIYVDELEQLRPR